MLIAYLGLDSVHMCLPGQLALVIAERNTEYRPVNPPPPPIVLSIVGTYRLTSNDNDTAGMTRRHKYPTPTNRRARFVGLFTA